MKTKVYIGRKRRNCHFSLTRARMAAVSMIEDGHADLLTKVEAQTRAALILGVPTYKIHLTMVKGSDTYTGLTSVTFLYRGEDHDVIFLDHVGKIIDSITVNGVHALGSEGCVWKGCRIYVPARLLTRGHANTIEIKYTNTFSNSGNGLHRFVDPSDGEVCMHACIYVV